MVVKGRVEKQSKGVGENLSVECEVWRDDKVEAHKEERESNC